MTTPRKPTRFKTQAQIERQIDKATNGITKLKQQIQTIEDARELLNPELNHTERRQMNDEQESLWSRISYRERKLKRLQSTLAMFQTAVIAGMGEADVVLQKG